MSVEKTVYFINEPWSRDGVRFEIVAVPAKVSAKTVKVEPCAATKFGAQFNIGACHFTAESALDALEKQIVFIEEKAAMRRAALEKLRASLLPGLGAEAKSND